MTTNNAHTLKAMYQNRNFRVEILALETSTKEKNELLKTMWPLVGEFS